MKATRVKQPLSVTHPAIAAEWHPKKNETPTPPPEIGAGSGRKVWWKCREGHEWQAVVQDRTRAGRESECRYCKNRMVSGTNSLLTKYPEVAAEWHPTKNAELTPDRILYGSNQKVWWKCSNETDHEWQARVVDRTVYKRGCPSCARSQSGKKRRQRATGEVRFLSQTHPELVAEWHSTRNNDLGITPDTVTAGSSRKVWWKCSKDPEHEWQAEILQRTRTDRPSGCPQCAGKKVSPSNSLANYPEIAVEWHPKRNGNRTPDQVVAGTSERVWWKCPKGPDDEWRAQVCFRTLHGYGCPCCAGKKASVTNSLASLFPDIAAEWHPTRNDKTPDQVVAGSGKLAWWKCSKCQHEWKARTSSRTTKSQQSGCPSCNCGWTLDNIRKFVASLKDHVQSLNPAELYSVFQQKGLLLSTGMGKPFVNALATGRFPTQEITKFVNGEPSLVDELVQDPTRTLESLASDAQNLSDQPDSTDIADKLIEDIETASVQELPLVETKSVLGSLSLNVVTSADEEAVKFLLASAVAKIWKHAYRDERTALAQAHAFVGDGYAEQVRSRFLEEYAKVTGLATPDGYSFSVNGKPAPPNLMQRHFVVRVREQKRVGNWSGTGAGKTLAAVLATRIVGSRLTVVCCPNSVVEGWQRAIIEIFPDSFVATKTFEPDWSVVARQSTNASSRKRGDAVPRLDVMELVGEDVHRYLVLNYETFQQPDSAERVRALAARETIDFVIVDEIHFAKQRTLENISQRRQLVSELASLAAERNLDVHGLGMSATPVINNLQEGKSMVELVSGLAHDELNTRPTVPNCMKLHQRLVTLGIRWMPDYRMGYEQHEMNVDCSEFLSEIRALGRNGTPLALEQVLTRARLPVIREHIERKTLIYTHYVQGIDRMLRDAIERDGWKVGFYTGDDKTGLDGFLEGDVDVLLGSSAIGTGVDGLQQVCNRLIVNVLPWTAAEFEQLKGRIFRQGQRRELVTMVIPLTYAEVGSQRWSWCESKMQRLKFKKSIADAAVDGVVPEGHLRSPAQAYQDVIAWLERLDAGKVEVIRRPKIVVPLPSGPPAEVKRRQRRYGDFSGMNHKWNQSRSDTTHARLEANPEEWAQYHTLYREAREDWAVVPFDEVIRWCSEPRRNGLVVGDFGCGEAKLAEAVKDRHTVHSFDHVAANDEVIACDMAHVPLDDETLDVAVFSLSLMGTNITDYLREAYRTLKLGGDLHIFEATSHFSDRDQFAKTLKLLGFSGVDVEDKWKFTYIQARKSEHRPREGCELRF